MTSHCPSLLLSLPHVTVNRSVQGSTCDKKVSHSDWCDRPTRTQSGRTILNLWSIHTRRTHQMAGFWYALRAGKKYHTFSSLSAWLWESRSIMAAQSWPIVKCCWISTKVETPWGFKYGYPVDQSWYFVTARRTSNIFNNIFVFCISVFPW